MTKFLKKYAFLIIFLIIVVLGITLTTWTYWNNFKQFDKSNSTTVWGTFGDYIGGVLNPFLTFANIIIFIYISYRLIKYEAAHLTPKLIFTKYKRDTHYSIFNVGHGPALNIIVSYRHDDDDEWKEPYLVYSLKSGDSVELTMDYAKGRQQYGAKYIDIFGNVFTITCINDETSAPISGNHLKNWTTSEISRLWQKND